MLLTTTTNLMPSSVKLEDFVVKIADTGVKFGPCEAIDPNGYDWEKSRLKEEIRCLKLQLENTQIAFRDYREKANSRNGKDISVDKIIVNGDATIVFWGDGQKTIVKKSADDEYDLHHAFCAALAKRVYGHNSTVKKMVKRKAKVQKRKENNEAPL